MIITGKLGDYEIVRRFGSNVCMNYHICKDKHGRQLILAIASTVAQNGKIDQFSYLLGRLKESAEYYQALYDEHVGDGNLLNYGWLFPRLVESFTHRDQNGTRQLVILDFPDVSLDGATALREIPQVNQRVDLRTSAWIMGRMLKLSSFLHENNIYVPILLDEFLIIPDEHRLILLDWSQAIMGQELTEAYKSYMIKQAAECTLFLLGATFANGTWHYDYEIEEPERRYLEFLYELHHGKISEGNIAHQEFYKTVHSIWKKEFYPFTTHEK